MTKQPWHGVVVASALPFNDDLSVDYDVSPSTSAGSPTTDATASHPTGRSASTSA